MNGFLLIVLLFAFLGVGLISFALAPFLAKTYHKFHQKRTEKTTRKLEELYVEVRKKKLFMSQAVLPLISGAIGFIIFQNTAAAIAAAVFGFVAPSAVIKILEKKRREKFKTQLPDVLGILSSSLKAGLSLSQAIEVVVEEMPAPASQEFAMVMKETKMGLSLEQSFEKLYRRIQMEELNMLAIATLIAKETGGNLAIIFDTLVNTLREKRRVMEQIKTLTLQGRWQGIIMSALPVIFAVFVFKTNPTYLEFMLNSELGRGLLIYAVISEVIGVVMIQRISKMEG